MSKMSNEDRVDDATKKCVRIGDCLVWKGQTEANNGPKIGNDTGRRLFWEVVKDEKLKPEEVLIVTCGHEACLNVAHMRKMTRSDVNRMRDSSPYLRKEPQQLGLFGRLLPEVGDTREDRPIEEPVREIKPHGSWEDASDLPHHKTHRKASWVDCIRGAR